MSTYPELTERDFDAATPMAAMYLDNGFSTRHSVETNVMFAAASRTSRPSERPRSEMAAILCEWYVAIESDCSARYKELRADNPDLSKPEINAEPELVALNTLRRAIRQQRSIYTH